MATAKTRDKVHELSLAQILDDTALQPRKQMDLDILRDYSAAWAEGAEFPPIDVFFDGDSYWLGDGFYRVRSARKANLTAIRAIVHDGGKRDALAFSLGANADHGVRRTNEDKRKAVCTMLDDAEWCLWSDGEIARACRVGASLVSRLRESNPGLRGYSVRTRIGSNGVIKTSQPATPTPKSVSEATFRRPPAAMTQTEIRTKFVRRITDHLRKLEKEVVRDYPTPLGTIDIATSSRLYCFAVIVSPIALYALVGRMMVLRSLANPDAGITVVGHFPRSVGKLIAALQDMGIACETPEQLLAR